MRPELCRFRKAQPHEIHYALSNSFAFGGSNGVLIVRIMFDFLIFVSD